MTLTNSDLRKKYDLYLINSQSNDSRLSLILAACVFIIEMVIFNVFSISQSEMYTSTWTMFLISALSGTISTPLFFLLVLKKDLSHNLKLQSFLGIYGSMVLGFMLFSRVYAGPCDSDQFVDMWRCNPQANSRSLPQDMTLLLMLVPLLTSAMFYEMPWEAILGVWGVVVFWLIIACAYSGAINSISTILLYVPVSFFMIYENQRRNLCGFFYMRGYEETMGNTRQQAERFTSEYRSLMANITHDLKTVHNVQITISFLFQV